MGLRIISVFTIGILAVSAFSGSDDKFIKKYAMMKIYESCFGREIIEQIRNEMKVAVAKCSAMELGHKIEDETRVVTTPEPTPAPTQQTPKPTTEPQRLLNEAIFPNAIPISVQPLQDNNNGFVNEQSNNQQDTQKANFNPDRLHQAILAYRPNPYLANGQPLRSGPNTNNYYPEPYTFASGMGPFSNGNNGLFSPHGPFSGLGANGLFGNLPNRPFTGSGPISGAINSLLQPNAYSAAYPQFPPFYQPHYFGQRLSRQLDLNNHVDDLKSRLNGKVQNVTCVMQELGYLDSNLEPTYDKIIAKINSLEIQTELKRDIEDGVDFCKQFSQCIPQSQVEKSPFSNALMKPMFFFRCYKHKKLEACIMKDVRDRFAAVSEDNLDNIPEQDLFRKGKSADLSSEEKRSSNEDLTSSVFDFLFGNENMDLDGIF